MTVKPLSAPPQIQSALMRFADPEHPYEEQKEALNAMFTRAYLQKLMVAANGNQSRAARIAKLDRTYLGRLLLKYGMRAKHRRNMVPPNVQIRERAAAASGPSYGSE